MAAVWGKIVTNSRMFKSATSSRKMQVTTTPLHSERLPDARSPLLATLHDETSNLLCVALWDEQHLIVTLPWSTDTNKDTFRGLAERQRKNAVDCLRELRNGEREIHTSELVFEERRGTADQPGAYRLPIRVRPVVRTRRPELRMWPVRLKPLWKRTALGEHAVRIALWVLMNGIGCILAVVTRNWYVIYGPLIVLTVFVFPTWRLYRESVMSWFLLFALVIWMMALNVSMLGVEMNGDMRGTISVLLWPYALLMTYSWVLLAPVREVVTIDNIPLAISVSATDGLFRLHGTGVFSGWWHRAVLLTHVDKFHSFCNPPFTLNKSMCTYYVRVQRSDWMESSYVCFWSKDLTTLVVLLLNRALHQWRLRQDTHTSNHTSAIPLSE